MRQLPQTAEPDPFSDRYEADLRRGIGLSGESREFFVRGRLDWLAACLQRGSVEEYEFRVSCY